MANTTVVAKHALHYDGVTYTAGSAISMKESDVYRHLRDDLIHSDSPSEMPQVEGSVESVVASGVWELDMPPHDYLLKFPEGPYADLALHILEVEAEAEQHPSTKE